MTMNTLRAPYTGPERRSRRGRQFREDYDATVRVWNNLRRTTLVLAALLIIALAIAASCFL